MDANTAKAMTDRELMNAHTPLIFVPRSQTEMRAAVVRDNRIIEAELNRRGYTRG